VVKEQFSALSAVSAVKRSIRDAAVESAKLDSGGERSRIAVRGVEHIPWLYDASLTILERTGLRRWRQWLVSGARGRTLDLGTGTGRNLPLFDRDARVVALDLDRHSMPRARRRAPHVPLVVARAEALPFRDRTFHTVVSGLVFCSVDDPDQGLAEVRRVLAPDGELRMLEHVRSTNRLLAWWQDRTQPAWTWFAGGCRPNRDTEATVRRSGFVIDHHDRRAQRSMRRFRAQPKEPR
jgi:ubiquinone/menaquinone biosynthesis C-methylase UbiE